MSNLFYFTAFSTQDLGPITARVISGSSSGNPNLVGQFFTGFSCSIDYQSYSDLLVSLGSAFNTQTPGNTTTFRYDLDSQRIIMSSSLNSTWFFQSSSMKILGFNQQYSNQNVITGSTAPGYIWVSTYDERSDDTGVFEDQPIYNERVADSGRSYAIGQIETINMRFWGQSTEPKENVFAAQKVDSFTWEEFIRENRKGPYPFVVFNTADTTTLDYSSRDGTYLLFADKMKFDPKQMIPDYFDYWNITDIKTRVLSEPNNAEDNFDVLPTTGSFFELQGNLLYHMAADAGSKISVSGSTLKSTQFFDTSTYLNSSSITTGSNIIYQPGSSLVMNGQPAFEFTSSLAGIVPVVSGASTPITPNGLTFIATMQLKTNTSSSVSARNTYDTRFINQNAVSNSFTYNFDSNTRKVKAIILGQSSSYFEASGSAYSVTASDKLMLITTIDPTTNNTCFYINGIMQPDYSAIATSSFNFSSNTFTFIPGMNTSSMNFNSYYLSDFMVYGNKLSASNLNNLQSYFGNKYNISYTSIAENTGSVFNALVPPITGGLMFYGNLYSSNTIVRNGLVQKLGDDSGNARHLTQSSTTSQPRFNRANSNFGNRPTLDFDGINDYLLTSSFVAMSQSTIYIVYGQNGYTSFDHIMIIGGGTFNTTDQALGVYFNSNGNSPNFRFQHPTGSANYSARFLTTTASNTNRIVGVGNLSSGGALWTTYLNGISSGTTLLANSTGSVSSTGSFSLGAIQGVQNFSGSISDILIYSGSHTPTQVATMDEWLRIKNGL